MNQARVLTRLCLLAAALAAAGLAQAQEYGRVLSTTPVLQQVAVPRQVCTQQQVVVQQQKSGVGAVMGAIAGGVIGSTVGGGSGRAVATILGTVGGAALGDHIEGGPAPVTQNVQHCSTQTFYETRPVAYNVVYEYAGKQYTVQMPHDPGPQVQLQITPVGSSAPPPTVQAPAATVTTVAVTPAPVVVAPAVVTAPAVVYTRPYYSVPPVSIHLGIGWWGHRHHRHGHSRHYY